MAEKNNIFCKIFLKLGNNKKNGMDEGGEEESTSEKKRNWKKTGNGKKLEENSGSIGDVVANVVDRNVADVFGKIDVDFGQ